MRLLTNINLLSDMRLAMQIGAEGVGLYRTEFPFFDPQRLPDRRRTVRHLPQGRGGRRRQAGIVFRTLDVGGDKALAYGGPREANPFLGLRSIRFSLVTPGCSASRCAPS